MQNEKQAMQNAKRKATVSAFSFCVLHCLFFVLHFLVPGCAARPPASPPEGPAARAAVAVAPATFGGAAGRRVTTAHYLIETTLDDADLVDRVAQVMEGALGQYRKLAPDVPPTDRPLECFVFANRNQWAQFTESQTGQDAKVYLRINRGGYAVRDWYVAYFIGERETLSVAAHEGFHQYVGRHFKRRPPPFLEEGLASLFEAVEWERDLPRWRWSSNPTRANGLTRAVRDKATLSLDELCTMHAGQIVSKQARRVEAFYAQAWGFARFLMDGQNGKYRDGLARMLADLAADRGAAVNAGPGPQGLWNPRTARPLLEHYLGGDLDQIDGEYQAYLRLLVDQWYSPAGVGD
jgi:hypothetical protein